MSFIGGTIYELELAAHHSVTEHNVMQVVVHNLPWNTTWQQLKDAFADTGTIERADVIIDSSGRSRSASMSLASNHTFGPAGCSMNMAGVW